MLKNKLLIGLTALGLSVNAQWNMTGNNIYNSNTGNVGIGFATAPQVKLQIQGLGGNNVDFLVNGRMKSDNNDGGLWVTGNRFIGGAYTDKFGIWTNSAGWAFMMDQTGKLGLGTISPLVKLDVRGAVFAFQDQYGGGTPGVRAGEFFTQNAVSGSYTAPFAINTRNATVTIGSNTAPWVAGQDQVGILNVFNAERSALYINGWGNVGIGTNTPNGNYKLDVAGNLHVDGRVDAKDVCVTPSGFCDFVFDENYKLMGLDSLKGYIEKNKHLPHFPSEKQIVKNGMSITDITLSQTRTIEELVLYTIKQQEIIEKLLKDVAELKTKQ